MPKQDNLIIHKMVVNDTSDGQPHDSVAHTVCGKHINAYYPMSGYASSGEVGEEQFRVTLFDSTVDCEKCLDEMGMFIKNVIGDK